MINVFSTPFVLVIMLTFSGNLEAKHQKKQDAARRKIDTKQDAALHDRLFSLRKKIHTDPLPYCNGSSHDERTTTYLSHLLTVMKTSITQRTDVIYAPFLQSLGSGQLADLRYSYGKIRDEMIEELSFLSDPNVSRAHLMSWLGEARAFFSTKVHAESSSDTLWRTFQDRLRDFIQTHMDRTRVVVKVTRNERNYRYSIGWREVLFSTIDKTAIPFTNDELNMMHQLDLLVLHYLSNVMMLLAHDSNGNPEGMKALLNEHVGWIDFQGHLYKLYRLVGIDHKIIKMRMFSYMLRKIAFYERYYSFFSTSSLEKRCEHKTPLYYSTMLDCDAVLYSRKKRKK